MRLLTRCPTCGRQRRQQCNLAVMLDMECPKCGGHQIQGLAEVSVTLPEWDIELQRLVGEFECEECGLLAPASDFQ